ncbi:MAG: hypothetical protein AAB658_16830 [Chloroflexota bacterium]
MVHKNFLLRLAALLATGFLLLAAILPDARTSVSLLPTPRVTRSSSIAVEPPPLPGRRRLKRRRQPPPSKPQ